MDLKTYLQLRRKAFDLVASTSQGVVRFHSPVPKQPYWNHLMNVHDFLIAKGAKDYEVLIAAILHDVIEDSETTIEYIRENFSNKIASTVELVTKTSEVDEDNFYNKILTSGNMGVLQIKVADRIDNALTNYCFSNDITSVEKKLIETKKYFVEMAEIVGWSDDMNNVLSYLELVLDQML